MVEADFFEKVVARSIRRLSRRDRELVEMRYMQSMTFREMALRLSLTQSRVSQLNKRVLARLRSRICDELDLAS